MYYSIMWINACSRNVVESTSNERWRKTEGRKRKKNTQKKEDIKAAFLHCKDKFVCEGKRKCAANGLRMCKVCSSILYSTCDIAACKTAG